ncbi:unnamed protein product [Camellia sinensis]
MNLIPIPMIQWDLKSCLVHEFDEEGEKENAMKTITPYLVTIENKEKKCN